MVIWPFLRHGKFVMWLIALRFILGIGIGGDYPVSATIMSEFACKQHRGSLVSLVFAMQAAGLIFGPLFAAALLSTHVSHDLVWRILLAFGAVPALAVYWQRRKLRESPRFLRANGMTEDESGRIIRIDNRKGASHAVSFWDGFHRLVADDRLLSRLIGASAAWFLMDAAYYGNTVSSPMVLSALSSDHTLMRKMLTQLFIFVVFAAPGYLASALAMDRLGRKPIQWIGFGMMAITFTLLALMPGIQNEAVPFVVTYGLSFFFTEFGPNATTFVYPSEIFPVKVRTTAHGIAAAMGKMGGFLGVFLPLPDEIARSGRCRTGRRCGKRHRAHRDRVAVARDQRQKPGRAFRRTRPTQSGAPRSLERMIAT